MVKEHSNPSEPTLRALRDAQVLLNLVVEQWGRNTISASVAAKLVCQIENDLLTARHNMEIHAGD